mgnify:CR=1 FL=1
MDNLKFKKLKTGNSRVKFTGNLITVVNQNIKLISVKLGLLMESFILKSEKIN